MLKEYNSTKRQQGIEDPKVSRTTAIHTNSIGRWQRDLDRPQIDIALRELGDLLPELGYDIQ